MGSSPRGSATLTTGRQRRARHRCDVAEVCGHRLPPHAARPDFGENEVRAVHQHVGGDEQRARRRRNGGAVVARADEDAGIGRRARPEPRDVFELTRHVRNPAKATPLSLPTSACRELRRWVFPTLPKFARGRA